MKKIYFSLVWIILVSLAQGNNCLNALRSYSKNAQKFDVCKKSVCFAFIDERPFQIVDDENDQIPDFPIPCGEAKSRGIKGALFNIISDIGKNLPYIENAYCVWGGRDCTYNGLMTAVQNFSKEPYSYQLTVGGMLFYIEERVTEWTNHSAPLIQGNIHLISSEQESPAKSALEMIAQPYRLLTWISAFVFAGILGLLLFFIFRMSRIPDNNFLEYLKKYFLPKKAIDPIEDHNRIRTENWFILLGVFLTICFLFYEVGFILDGTQAETVNMLNLEEKALKEYAVTGGSAQALIFQEIVDPKREYDHTNERATPWVEYKNYDEIFESVHNESSKYAVTYEHVSNYYQSFPEYCKVKVVASKDLKAQYTSFWWYGNSVPEEKRFEINGQISELREKGVIRKHITDTIEAETNSTGCHTPPENKLGPFVLLFPVAVTIFPFAIYLLYYLTKLTNHHLRKERGKASWQLN